MPSLMDTVPDTAPTATADPERPLLSHLDELRKRFLLALVFFIILAAAVPFSYSSFLFGTLKRPISGVADKLVFFSPTGSLTLYLNISFAAGLVFEVPVMSYMLGRLGIRSPHPAREV